MREEMEVGTLVDGGDFEDVTFNVAGFVYIKQGDALLCLDRSAAATFAQSLLAALSLSPRGAVGDMVLVPREPTTTMKINALAPGGHHLPCRLSEDDVRAVYLSMLVAAPPLDSGGSQG